MMQVYRKTESLTVFRLLNMIGKDIEIKRDLEKRRKMYDEEERTDE